MIHKVVCIGDSITYGFPYGPEFSWVALVAKATGVNMINIGENGDSTRLMAYRFKREVLELKPTHVIIMGGTNDAYVNEPLEVIKDNMQTMTRKAMAVGTVPIIALPIPANDKCIESNLRIYRSWMVSYAKENNIDVIDLGPDMIDPISGAVNKDLYMDDVHPSVNGYATMATVIQNFILKR